MKRKKVILIGTFVSLFLVALVTANSCKEEDKETEAEKLCKSWCEAMRAWGDECASTDAPDSVDEAEYEMCLDECAWQVEAIEELGCYTEWVDFYDCYSNEVFDLLPDCDALEESTECENELDDYFDCALCAPGCFKYQVGDGNCDIYSCNNADCDWDGGDCD